MVHDDPVQLHLTIGDEQINTTPEHPFFTMLRGWVAARALRVGDQVRQLDGSYASVQQVVVDATPRVMYNLTVAEAHTFFVGDGQWLVHNAGCNVFPEGRSLTSSGEELAERAKMYYMTLSTKQMEYTTVAVTKIDGKFYVTTNATAVIPGSGVMRTIKQWASELGDEYVEHTPLSLIAREHAEQHLYKSLDNVEEIGIGHAGGPCLEKCRPYFANKDVSIFWLENREAGWMK